MGELIVKVLPLLSNVPIAPGERAMLRLADIVTEPLACNVLLFPKMMFAVMPFQLASPAGLPGGVAVDGDDARIKPQSAAERVAPGQRDRPRSGLDESPAAADRAAIRRILIVAADLQRDRAAAGVVQRRALLPDSPPRLKAPMPGLNCRALSALTLTVLFCAAAALASCSVPWLIVVPPE